MTMPAKFSESLLKRIREEVGSRLDLSADLRDEDIRETIARAVMDESRERYLRLAEKQELISAVFNSMRRLDVIQPLLEDEAVTEIMINGPEHIFIEKDGHVRRVDLHFESAEKLENVIQFIVAKVNRTVNEASPIVDARLRDGSRVSVVLFPVALNGPVMTIRKFPEKPLSVRDLINRGSICAEAVGLLEKLVRAKYNIFISGGTGSGKTTFLNALAGFIPENERIITIEDSAELQIVNIQNLVSMETRNSNTEGRGEITIRELIKTSLRMRPDRIIVGEVRGAEALDMLQAMNTGHDGSLSTGHANNSGDMLSRLETMVLSGAPLPVAVIRKQIAAALDIIIHLGRLRDGSRKVLEISEVQGFSEGDIILNTLFAFQEKGEDGGRVLGTLEDIGNRITKTVKARMAGIELD